MFQRGLKENEIALLEAAGFAPEAVRMIVREAQGLRWLFINRLGPNLFLTTFAFVSVGLLAAFFQDKAGWIMVLVPLFVFGIYLLPELEIRALKAPDPPRWAARNLAMLALRAAISSNAETSTPFTTLKTHADTAASAGSQSALAAIARRMAQETGRKARKRYTPGSGAYSVAGALRFGLIILTISAIIILLALGARPF